MSYDFRSPRLYVGADLSEGAEVAATAAQANYLVNVLRLREGDSILLFNGRDGEWRARLAIPGRKRTVLMVEARVREQTARPDLRYVFAPLKHARLDYMVEKAVEMGVGRLSPVITQYTQVARLNLKRMHANAIEAAEQCGILSLPDIDPPQPLDALLAGWDPGLRLIFCDEAASITEPVATLQYLERAPVALLVGPEGGFSAEERARLLALPYVTAVSLGPRVLRADTAAVAALALVQTFIGDWR